MKALFAISTIIGFSAVVALVILLWQQAWNVVMPIFGVPRLSSFIQSMAMWTMMCLVALFISMARRFIFRNNTKV
jgi:hypothetical protein